MRGSRRLTVVNWFSDTDDARRYITEITRIWAVWIIGLAALFAVTNWWVLRYMNPDRVHVMVAGRVVESGGPEIVERLESEGYTAVR